MVDGANELTDRFLDFGVRVVRVARELNRTSLGRPMATQMLRCDTSCGANYEEARAAESRRDFIHKLGLSLKELRECRFWLLLIQRGEAISPPRVTPLQKECEELAAIMAQSIITAKNNSSGDTAPDTEA